MCGGLLLEVCVCRNQFSHQLRLQTLEVGGGQELRHKFAFSISVMCVYQDVMWRQVMWIIAKEGILTGQKQACSKIARCWGVRSSQCKNGLKHNRMVFWWRPSNQSHDQTRPTPNYLHINKERGIVFQSVFCLVDIGSCFFFKCQSRHRSYCCKTKTYSGFLR